MTEASSKEEKKEEEEVKEEEKKEKKDEKELSAEDQALLEGLELAVERLQDVEAGVQRMALDHLVKEVRAATSSMTSVPKPLKFLRPHYDTLKTVFDPALAPKKEEKKDDDVAEPKEEEKNIEQPKVVTTTIAAENKEGLADLLAVLAMTMAPPGTREMLYFKQRGTKELGSWGHEFVRSLAGEIGEAYAKEPADDLLELVEDIVPFHLQHNAEAEAVDLLIETSQLSKFASLVERNLVHEDNYRRICLYLTRCAQYMPDPDDLKELYEAAFFVYRAMGQFPDALRVALAASSVSYFDDDDDDGKDDMADDDEEPMGKYAQRLKALFDEAPTKAVKKQMALIVGRHGLSKFEYEDDPEINELLGNNSMATYFKALAKDLDVEEAKTPEDIYKSHLGDTYSSSTTSSSARAAQRADSARANLAATFVNCLVNAGFGTDTLMTAEGNEWLYKNKDHGMLSAAASLGLILMWDVEDGLTKIDKFLHSTDDNVRAGACLAIGVVSANVRHEADPPIALLPEYLEGEGTPLIIQVAAIEALGIAYAGCARDDAKDVLAPFAQSSTDMTAASFAALALGEIYVGTCDHDVAAIILQRLMETADVDLDAPAAKFLALGLALVFMGSMDKADATLEALKTIDHEIARYASVALEGLAYAGTGNVLKIQRMLHICAERLDGAGTKEAKAGAGTAGGSGGAGASEPKAATTQQPGVEESKTTTDSSQATSNGAAAAAAAKENQPQHHFHQSVAVLGISLVAAADDVGSEMALRTFDHLLHYGEPAVRRAVPLALALLKVGNPEYAVVDAMSRLTHDADPDVAAHAIFGLGLLSCGTNNSRVAGLLRQLAEHSREANNLFVVRLAQGLLHLGKGLLGVSPFHADRFLMNKPSLAGLVVVVHAALDMKHTLLDKLHFLLFHIAPAIMPRFLVTVDAESLDLLPASVRVGQAVDTVGQAGKPKSITGFQTHSTPVLLGVGDRAELANDDFIPLSTTLEGIVLLEPNPDAEKPENDDGDASATPAS